MSDSFLDNPLILSFLFYPRPATPGGSRLPNISDGAIPVEGDVVLGYRLYAHQPGAPVIVLFHGNGEIAPDYDDIAPLYHHAGASLLVVDFRGYGWSTGRPLVSALLADVEPVHQALAGILEKAGLSGASRPAPLLIMGRSLGSACAVEWARQYPDSLKGLIVESGFARAIPLLARLGLPMVGMVNIPDPINNLGKMKSINLPLLVIHGEEDTLIPVEEGQALYDASPVALKRIIRIAGAGHNDLLYYAEEYFAALAAFVREVVGGG